MARYLNGVIIGAQVFFCANGTSLDSATTGATVVADIPETNAAFDTDSPWLSMGRVMTATSEFSNKEVEIEGCSDSLDDDIVHGYQKETITLQDKKNYKFSTKSVSAEAMKLSNELLASDNLPYLEGWLYVRHITVLGTAGAQELAHCCIYGRLKLANSLGASSDAQQVDYQFDIIKNILASSAIDGFEDLVGE